MTKLSDGTEFAAAIDDVTTVQAPKGKLAFSYSDKHQSTFRRSLIRGIEILSGSKTFERLYETWKVMPRGLDDTIFASAIATLGVKIEFVSGNADAIPATGAVLVVANHPFGIIDGLLIGHLASLGRSDVKLMVHSLLAQPPGVKDSLLPVDFSGTSLSRRVSASTRKRAVDWLHDGHVLVIFPAGGISTSPKPWSRRAADPAWHPFVARLAARPGVKTVPIFVHGQNSRLFQVLSHVSYPLRIAMIFHETKRRLNQPVQVAIGAVLECAGMDRDQIVEHLRTVTLSLGGADPKAEYRFPKWFRF
jgi:putative hemolysin